MTKYLALILILVACNPGTKKEESYHASNDSINKQHTDSITTQKLEHKKLALVNDTLNDMAAIMAGMCDSSKVFPAITANLNYKDFAAGFSKRWNDFDSNRVTRLLDFRNTELQKAIKTEPTLFYPFSGPDILYPVLFFPDATKYILVGLEPVGSLPEFKDIQNDTLKRYFNKLNTSLNAILKFSFFRTESMSKDLKNTEINGTLHLLFLFLNRSGNTVVSAKAFTLDSLGNKVYLSGFNKLAQAKEASKGIEIMFNTANSELKELSYFSLNMADYALKGNKGFKHYLAGMQHFNTYLKGASYLLHKEHFSVVRNTILNGSTSIVQDDSGIAFSYFEKDGVLRNYKLFGTYSKPIAMFSNRYQKDLDSLYKKQGSTPLGFGIGYNFKDKNSNLMIITKN